MKEQGQPERRARGIAWGLVEKRATKWMVRVLPVVSSVMGAVKWGKVLRWDSWVRLVRGMSVGSIQS